MAPYGRRGLFEKTNENFLNKIEIPQNWFLRGLNPAEHEFGNEKLLRCIIEGPRVDFQENFKFAE